MEQILKRKDIVLAPFPFTDQSGGKRRPVLVLSNDRFNDTSQNVIVCAITSNISNDPYSIYIKAEDWKDGMYSESCIKAWNILTLDKKLVIKRIGRLSSGRFNEAIAKISEIMK